MITFKKMLKYIFLLLVTVIFLWLSYGFYLYINLPDIEIKDKTIKSGFSSRGDLSMMERDILISEIENLVLPEKRSFRNNESYSFLMPQLLASGVIIFEAMTLNYVLCFDDPRYSIFLESKVWSEELVTPGRLLGFEYRVNDKVSLLDNINPRLFKQDNFPYGMKLVKGKSCDGKVLETYTLSLTDKKNETIYYRGRPSPKRSFNLNITKKEK